LVTGVAVLPKRSARNLDLQLTTVSQTKDTTATKIVNFPAQYLGLANSVIIDNQDAASAVTVRINRGVNSITIPPSNWKAFNDAWIEQMDLSGASTDAQMTAQVATLSSIMPGAYEGVTN
jgi:hypothetical protein